MILQDLLMPPDHGSFGQPYEILSAEHAKTAQGLSDASLYASKLAAKDAAASGAAAGKAAALQDQAASLVDAARASHDMGGVYAKLMKLYDQAARADTGLSIEEHAQMQNGFTPGSSAVFGPKASALAKAAIAKENTIADAKRAAAAAAEKVGRAAGGGAGGASEGARVVHVAPPPMSAAERAKLLAEGPPPIPGGTAGARARSMHFLNAASKVANKQRGVAALPNGATATQANVAKALSNVRASQRLVRKAFEEPGELTNSLERSLVMMPGATAKVEARTNEFL